MVVMGFVGYLPARHVQLVEQHQAYLAQVARDAAEERQHQAQQIAKEQQRRADLTRQQALEAQRHQEALQKAAEAKQQRAAAEAKKIADEQAAEQRRAAWQAQEVQRAKVHAVQEAQQAAEAERAQQAREAEVERRAEEGPYDSDAVEDMCWTTIEARAEAEFTAQANRGDAWYKYNLPTRFSGTRSWKWRPKVKLTLYDSTQPMVLADCVVTDDGQLSLEFLGQVE